MDQLIPVSLVLLAVAILFAAIVLPVVALLVSLNTRKRISDLEALIARLQPGPTVQHPPTSEPQPATPAPAPQPVRANQIESVIGRRWVGWIAITLILFATAFFLRYAFDNRWIGELGRVSIGIAFGIGMGLAGFRYHKRGWRTFSQILTAGGIVLLYLSIYAAFAYYHLVGQKTAFVFLVILIAETALLARTYNAPAIAIMSLVGGFLNPVLLQSDQDQYRSFFAYLVALDVGALALLKRWRGLSSVAYFGTQLLFWLWCNENYQIEKRTAVLVFQTTVFLIFLVAHFGRNLIRREPVTNEDIVLLLVNPFVFFATAYSLLEPTHDNWMGAFAIGMALLYASMAQVLRKRSSTSRRETLLLVAIAITFVTIAIPIQLNANWITLAWAIEGLTILWVSLETRSLRLRAQAFVSFGLAFFKLILGDTPYGDRPEFIPIFNRYFLPSLCVIACFAGAAYLYQRAREKGLAESQIPRLILGLLAVIAFWFVISVETQTFFISRARAAGDPEVAANQRWLGQMALSVIWALYAGALAAVGFIRRSAAIRWASLVLFALTIIKAMLVDVAELQQFYRIIVLFVLGVLLLLVAWAYHKTQEAQKT